MADRARSEDTLTSRFATAVSTKAGTTGAFIAAVSIVLIWGLTGPIFGFSDTWQLVINTGTTIVTFLMVFLIQRAQNKDSLAVQLKLNELVAAVEGASNRLISVEDLSEQELKVLRQHYQRLAEMSRDRRVEDSHSLDQAAVRHHAKRQRREDAARS